jgi:hypothetical protein
MTYTFGEFEVDAAAYEVRQGGTRIRLTRQPMEILLCCWNGGRRAGVARGDGEARCGAPTSLPTPTPASTPPS